MKFEFRAKFNSIEELNTWLDNCCIRCAMCNREGRDRCDVCKVNRQYKTAAEELGLKKEDLEDDK